MLIEWGFAPPAARADPGAYLPGPPSPTHRTRQNGPAVQANYGASNGSLGAGMSGTRMAAGKARGTTFEY